VDKEGLSDTLIFEQRAEEVRDPARELSGENALRSRR
jgi:hypothetical protein